ncbi:uncharacterized protein A4U43_C05F26790 [Asparagus officinalis]|uniref:Uncharacterized protein n=1 Tax=Asparagus officinalis TaxID=4686 RepID=A0A5P1EWC0_ASPOF|nr:uncharacterized protein LOC109840625 [Asparagus officinalis]XP_020264942.1 uncharacterized protein LOC109840625 [Asparagus officinalis]ONK69793.1 uncharacterized protein A4U43_C05F26790 [Asparagus officinalis]
MEKTKPAPKRRKIEAKDRRTLPSQAATDKGKTTLHNTSVPTEQARVKDLKIQQAKMYAVTQAQHEGWLGNFRGFDSPFGNYLVPVIPTHADLFGAAGPLKNP